MIVSRRVYLRSLGAAGCAVGLPSSSRAEPADIASFSVGLPDGRRLACRRYGPVGGAPAFYFHGMPGSCLEPDLIADEIAAGGLQLIAVDRPGVGCSDRLADRTICDWPDDVLRLANCLGWPQFGVIGLSGGAPFALACAARLPDRVSRVALVSGHAPFVECVESGNQDQLVKAVSLAPRLASIALLWMKRKLETDPQATMEKLVESWTDADRRLVFDDPHRRCSFLMNLRRAFEQPRGLAEDIALLARPWGFPLPRAARCAQIVIWQGGCDGLAPPSHGRFFHRSLPGSRLVLDPQTSHVTTAKRYAHDIVAHVAGA